MGRLCLYFRGEPERDRWIRGDRFAKPLARRLLRGKARPGGLDKVFTNLDVTSRNPLDRVLPSDPSRAGQE